MKSVMKRQIAEETTEKNGRLSLTELKLMMMIIVILSMFLYIVASKLINWFHVCAYVFSDRSHCRVSVHIRSNLLFTSTIDLLLSTAFEL